MSARIGNRPLVTSVGLLFVGLIGLLGMGGSVFDRVRSVDILRLLASGACLGAAIYAFVHSLRGRTAPRN